jgi:hypothetical protein
MAASRVSIPHSPFRIPNFTRAPSGTCLV